MNVSGVGELRVLEVIDARCALRRLPIFSGVNLTVLTGERIHLGGPNGSGKTTLLRCAAGTLCLDRGRIRVGGSPAGTAAARRQVGLCVNPEQGLQLDLTGRQNLLFAARLRLPADLVRAAVSRVEDEFAITPFAEQKTQHYSAGMRARVTIARALLGDPALLLIDEPTRSLDAAGRELFWAALDRRRSAACVIASHLEEDVARCDRSCDLTAQHHDEPVSS